MPSDAFGGFSVRTGYTDGFARSTDTLITTRACSDGTRPITVWSISGAVSGRGGARTLQMYLGSAARNMSVPAEANAVNTGWQNSTDWTTLSGASVQYGYRDASGSFYFARSSSSGANGVTTNNGVLTGYVGMNYQYYQGALPPALTLTPSSDGTSMSASLVAPSDNGGTPVTGYRLQRATNSTFTTGLATINLTGVVVVTDLVPGQLYYWRVTSRNLTTDTRGILGGPWSATQAVVQPDSNGVGRRWNGTLNEAMDMRRWNGTTWDAGTGKRYDTPDGWEELGA